MEMLWIYVGQLYIVAAQAPVPDSAVIQRQLRPLQNKLYDAIINMYVSLITNYLY